MNSESPFSSGSNVNVSLGPCGKVRSSGVGGAGRSLGGFRRDVPGQQFLDAVDGVVGEARAHRASKLPGPDRATLLCRSGCKLPPAGTRVDTQCGTLRVTADAPDGTPLGVVVRASLK